MTITADSREKRPEITNEVDKVTLLTYGESGHSYDILVESDDGASYRFEIKQWDDFVYSWTADKLERQLSAVDGFIVERNMFHEAHIEMESGMMRGRELQERATLHLANLAATMWVIPSSGPQETIAILRYIEKKGRGLGKVRANRIEKAPDLPLKEKLLSVLPNINVDRTIRYNDRLGRAISDIVDWSGVTRALNLDKWKELPGIGDGTVKKIERELNE